MSWNKKILLTLIILLVLWGGGLVIFNQTVFTYLNNETIIDNKQKFGLVALTGGRNRIKKAVEILNQNQDSLLLISGVTPGITLKQIMDIDNINKYDESKIKLGYTATSTLQNAKEVYNWNLSHNFNKLYVVTSFYHIPRSRLELERKDNVVDLEFIAVDTPYILPNWWSNIKTFLFLANEYNKFLFVYVQYKILGL